MLVLAFWPALTAAQTSPDEAYAQAARHYQAANWPAATASLRKFIALFPQDARTTSARFYLGEAHLQVGQLAPARASYRAYLDQLDQHGDPADAGQANDAATARFRIGETSFLLGHRPQAETALDDFCRRYPDHALLTYALPYLAELALMRDDFEEALRLADRQLSLGCQRPFETHLIIARSYHAMRQFDAARAACLQISRDSAASFEMLAKALLITAQTYVDQEMWESAVREYQRLAALRPVTMPTAEATETRYRAAALLHAAECYQHLGERQRAALTYTTVLLEFPGTESSASARQRLAELSGNPAT